MQKHTVLMRKLRQRPNFLWLVDRPHLGGVRDGNHPRLRVVLIADARDRPRGPNPA